METSRPTTARTLLVTAAVTLVALAAGFVIGATISEIQRQGFELVNVLILALGAIGIAALVSRGSLCPALRPRSR